MVIILVAVFPTPDLRNFRVHIARCCEGDMLLLVSDGVHDNLDPELRGSLPSQQKRGSASSQTCGDSTRADGAGVAEGAAAHTWAQWREAAPREYLAAIAKGRCNNLAQIIKTARTKKDVPRCVVEACKTLTESSRYFASFPFVLDGSFAHLATLA